MQGLSQRTSCRPHFKKLGFLTVIGLYLYSLFVFLYKNKQRVTKRQEMHKYNTRQKEDIHVPYTRLVISDSQPLIAASECFNKLTKLDGTFKQKMSLSKFKKECKAFLVNKCYYTLDEFCEDS